MPWKTKACWRNSTGSQFRPSLNGTDYPDSSSSFFGLSCSNSNRKPSFRLIGKEQGFGRAQQLHETLQRLGKGVEETPIIEGFELGVSRFAPMLEHLRDMPVRTGADVTCPRDEAVGGAIIHIGELATCQTVILVMPLACLYPLDRDAIETGSRQSSNPIAAPSLVDNRRNLFADGVFRN